MSTPMLENKLTELAEFFYQSPNNQKEVEAAIQELKNQTEFDLTLFNLISNPDVNEKNALFFINILKTEIKSKKSELGNCFKLSDIKLMIKNLIHILQANNGVKRKRQEFMAELISLCLKKFQKNNDQQIIMEIKMELINQVCNYENYLSILNKQQNEIIDPEEILSNQNFCQFMWANFQILTVVLDRINDNNEYKLFLNKINEFMKRFFDQFGFSLTLFITSNTYNSQNCSQEVFIAKMNKVNECFQILFSFSDALKIFIKKWIRCIYQINIETTDFLNYIKTCDIILNLRLNSLMKNNNNLLFNPTTNDNLNEILMKTKSNMFDTAEMLIMFYKKKAEAYFTNKNLSEKKFENQKIVNMFNLHTTSIVKTIISSLLHYFKFEEIDLDEIENSQENHFILVSSGVILLLASSSYSSYSILNTYKEELLIHVLMYITISTDERQLEAIDNPNNYINEMIICIFEEFDSRNYKANFRITFIALLNSLCQHIDSFSTYIIKLLTNSIMMMIQNVNTLDNIQNQEDKEGLSKLFQSKFWNQVSINKKIENCFFLLNVISKNFNERFDLVPLLKNFINVVYPYFSQVCNDNFQKVNFFFLFLSYYDLILQQDNVTSEKLFELLYTDMNTHKNVMLSEACDFIVDKLDKHNFYMNSSLEHINKCWKFVVANIVHNMSFSFFSTAKNLLEIIVKKYGGYPQPLSELLTFLLKYISENIENKDNKVFTKIYQIFQFLVYISKRKNIYLAHSEIIESHICQLFPLLEKPDSVISECILKCVNYWVLNKEQVSANSLSMINYLEKIQSINYNEISSFYKLLINFFNFADDQFDSNDIQTILNMAIKCIDMDIDKSANFWGECYAESFLLVQFIVTVFHKDKINPMTMESILNIFENNYLKYYNSFQYMYDDLDIDVFNDEMMYMSNNDYYEEELKNFNFRIFFEKLMGIFLVLVIPYSKEISNKFLVYENQTNLPVEQKNLKLSSILSCICSGLDDFSQNYDKKLLIISFSKLIECFYSLYIESQNETHFKILVDLISKTVLIVKYFSLKTECENILQKKNTNTESYAKELSNLQDIFGVVRAKLNISQPLSKFFDDLYYSNVCSMDYEEYDDDFYKMLSPKKKQILSKITSPFAKINELEEFSRIIKIIKQNEPVFSNIYNNLDNVAKAHFKSTTFQFEILEINHFNKKEQIYRKIVKLKKRN